jgi:hypothetical protein
MQTAKASKTIRFVISLLQSLLQTVEHFRMRGAVAPNGKTRDNEGGLPGVAEGDGAVKAGGPDFRNLPSSGHLRQN